MIRRTYLWILLLPLSLTLLGASLNQAVLIANGGKFPVQVNPKEFLDFTEEAIHNKVPLPLFDNEHFPMTPNTRLNFLADIFPIGGDIESIGDLGIDLGTFLWTFAPYVWGFAVTRKLYEMR